MANVTFEGLTNEQAKVLIMWYETQEESRNEFFADNKATPLKLKDYVVLPDGSVLARH